MKMTRRKMMHLRTFASRPRATRSMPSSGHSVGWHSHHQDSRMRDEERRNLGIGIGVAVGRRGDRRWHRDTGMHMILGPSDFQDLAPFS